MARWSIYAEVLGYPVFAEAEFDDEMDENMVWDFIYDDISQTLEVTKEEE